MSQHLKFNLVLEKGTEKPTCSYTAPNGNYFTNIIFAIWLTLEANSSIESCRVQSPNVFTKAPPILRGTDHLISFGEKITQGPCRVDALNNELRQNHTPPRTVIGERFQIKSPCTRSHLQSQQGANGSRSRPHGSQVHTQSRGDWGGQRLQLLHRVIIWHFVYHLGTKKSVRVHKIHLIVGSVFFIIIIILEVDMIELCNALHQKVGFNSDYWSLRFIVISYNVDIKRLHGNCWMD